MSAKLHRACARGKLLVRNVTSGEASLYYLVGKEVKHVAISPNSGWVNLLLFADTKSWTSYPSLKEQVNSGTIEVADVD